MTLGKRKLNIILLCWVILVVLINQPLLKEGFQRTVRGLFVSYSFIAITILWSISALECIREKNSRRVLKGIVGMLLFWLILRGVKYEVWDDTVNFYCWYLFYTPQTFLPLLVFYMTLHIDGTQKSKLYRLLLIPATLISFGILTNNYHQLAFKFVDGVMADGKSEYTYGPLYFISWAWMFFFMLAAIINATIKSRLQKKRRATHTLAIWLLVPVIYIIYYQKGPFFTRVYIFNFPEAYCLIYMIFLEICMASGLLITNRYHNEIFYDASIMAEITDNDCNTVHRTSLCVPLSMEEKKNFLENAGALEESSIVRKTYKLNSTELLGGRVFWLSDIKNLLNINKGLKNLGEELAEENNILEAEIAITEQKASLEEQNRIYDSINDALTDTQRKILDLLDDKSQLDKALLLAVFMKRKSNLIILSSQEDKTDIRELGLCINESFSYLRLGGCACSCTVIGNGSAEALVLSKIYEAFEEVLEQGYTGMNACLAFLKIAKDIISLRLLIDHEKDQFVDEEYMNRLCEENSMTFSLDRQDDGVYITFTVKEVAHA